MNLNNGKIFIYNLIFAPRKALQYSLKGKEDEHIGIALLVLICGIVLNLFSKALIFLNIGIIDMYAGIGGVFAILNMTGNIIIFTAVIFFIKHFSLTNARKNRNGALLFFKLICFSFIPFLFAPAVSMIGLFFKLFSGMTIFYLLRIALYLWAISLQILIVKELFDLKLLSSIALYVLPLIGLFAFAFIKIVDMTLFFFSFIL
ncbi:MAG: hypothetical protein KKH98_07575 [Spirochaetes bacterium]|nr:hypothetical protein [Spirochaetota bacterium]